MSNNHPNIFSNIYLGSPTPASASVKRNIDQNQYWNYNPTTERSAVKSYDPFRNAVSQEIQFGQLLPICSGLGSTFGFGSIHSPQDHRGAPRSNTTNLSPVILQMSNYQAEDTETTRHETASKITGYSYKTVSRPGSGEKEDYNSLHYSTSSSS